MKNIYLLLLLTLSISNIYPQVTQQWVQRYNRNGNSDDKGLYIVVDDSGNIYVTGNSNNDYATIKYNSSGLQQWVQIYNGPGNANDEVRSIILDDSGNVYVTGTSQGIGTSYDFATIKYNSSGIQQWVQRYNGPTNSFDGATSLTIDALRNIYVTGYGTGVETSEECITIKYNSSGIQQWEKRYNGPGNGNDKANCIVSDDSGNVYITGYSTGIGTYYDYTTIKYNSSGVQQWVQRYNGPGNSSDEAKFITKDNSSNVYITGYSVGTGTNSDYATIKYNSSGVQQWVQRYNGSGNNNDQASSIAVNDFGDVYVTGSSDGIGINGDYLTIKYNSSGVQQWVQRYNGPGNIYDYANSLVLDISGNVYITGVSGGVYGDYATIKYNSSGVQQWVQRYNGPGNETDDAISLTLDVSGNIYVIGYSAGIGTSYDFATIKYSQQVGIKEISSEIPSSFTLSQNYPNPFNPSTTITFEIPSGEGWMRNADGVGLITLKVFDVSGREITTLVNEELRPGIYEVTFDGSNLTSGVYFYKIQAGNFTQTKRMVLLK
jgi:hypothetical protein